MESIILAAGMGKRLLPLTKKVPKCMINFLDKSLLEYQVEVLKKYNFKQINVVSGYLENKITIPFVNKISNKNYSNTNMVYSLFCAISKIGCDEDLLITYGDIIYEEDVINKILKFDAPIVISADKNWKNYWGMRMKNILNDIESFKTCANDRVSELGQKVSNLQEVNGQFIGIIKIKRKYIKNLVLHWQEILSKGHLKNIKSEKIYMTDFLQYLINKKVEIFASFINSGWLEFDTIDDFNLYNKLVIEKKLNKFYNV